MLGAFLDRFDTGGLGVNLDPANLLMGGFDPYEAARALQGRVVHSNAKDARVSGASRTAQEVPLGHGDIDWTCYLAALEEIDYRGWLTVAREGLRQPRCRCGGGHCFSGSVRGVYRIADGSRAQTVCGSSG